MPHPGQTYLHPPADLIRAFMPDVAAEVPAVRLSRLQWANICDILRELSDLHDSAGPNGLGNALVEGRVIESAARQAHEMRHLAAEGDAL